MPDLQRPVDDGLDACPGRSAAKIARPDAAVLVATGDGAFLMNSQEIETALADRIPIVILIWVDDAYGLISWKMDLEIGHNVDTASAILTSSPTPRASARRATASTAADELLPTLRTALADDTVWSSPAPSTTRPTCS